MSAPDEKKGRGVGLVLRPARPRMRAGARLMVGPHSAQRRRCTVESRRLDKQEVAWDVCAAGVVVVAAEVEGAQIRN